MDVKLLDKKRKELYAIRREIDMAKDAADMDTLKHLAIVDVHLTKAIDHLRVAADLENMANE